MKLAIIGTAGRGEDKARLTIGHWHRMMAAARKVIELEEVTSLVSGGAAWADHVAVQLHLEDKIPVFVWMPATTRDRNIAKYYHDAFRPVLGHNTWFDATGVTGDKFGGFKDRNTKVAQAADVYLAMTFGSGPIVKDGGTADTVGKMRARGVRGYHLDLNTLKLYPTP